MQVQNVELSDSEEQFTNDKRNHGRREFLDKSQIQQSNVGFCKTEIKTEQDGMVYDSNIEKKRSFIKLEDLNQGEQSVDKNIIGGEFSSKNKNDSMNWMTNGMNTKDCVNIRDSGCTNHMSQEFSDKCEQQKSNYDLCKTEIKTEQTCNLQESHSNIEKNCALIKVEDVVIEEHPIDEKIFYEEYAPSTRTANEPKNNKATEITTDNCIELKIESDPSIIKKHHCTLCNYATDRKDLLKRHTDGVHSNSKKHRCTMCDFATNWKDTLKMHVDSIHLDIKKHLCTICEFAGARKIDLKRHMDSAHFNIRNYSCTICDFAAVRKFDIKRHMNSVHLNIRKHLCTMCDYAKGDITILKRHIDTVHSDKKKYPCSLCDYRANVKQNLKWHMNSVHLKKKEHRCTECDFAVVTKNHLTVHIEAVHLKLKKYCCTLCPYKASSQSRLSKHMEAIHIKIKKK